MATNNDALGQEIDALRSEVTRLRGQIRVRLHLGAMDTRDAFARIEHDVEHAARDISQATRRALEKARAQLNELVDAFRSPPPPPTSTRPA
jgi:hypothetical protein